MNIISIPIIICRGSPTLMYSMNVYCPAVITSAFGGVENGDAKHMLAPNVTAKRYGTGLQSICMALCMAIGAMSTAVAVLLMNIVISDVVKYMPAMSTVGPYMPNPVASELDISSDVPVFSSACDIGSMAAMSTMLSMFMVL